MSIQRILTHILTLIVGFSVTLPYFYGRKDFDYWLSKAVGVEWVDLSVHGVLLGMIVLFCFAVRATALLSTDPSAWRSNGRLNNVQGLLEYRDSRLKGMTNADGSVLMRETQALDAMGSFPQGTEAHRVAEYMNARLGGMTYAQGLEFMKSNRK